MSKFYKKLMAFLDPLVPQKLQPVWQHPAGPRTIFFWAPTVKWGLVIAATGDLRRPVEQLSLNQTGILTLTGFIWSRYSLVIIPKNWNMFGVNIFVGLTGLYQLSRIIRHRLSEEDNKRMRQK